MRREPRRSTRTRRLGSASVALTLVLSGCGPSTASEPTEHDFLGRIAMADLSRWRTSERVLSPGHDEFELLVGPGVITLEDERRLVVPARTPGGNMCVHLGGELWDGSTGNLCFIIGEYVDDGPEVAWFGLIGDGPDLPRGHIRVRLHAIEGGDVMVDELGRLFRFALADEVDLHGCDGPDRSVRDLRRLPDAAAHYGRLDVAEETVYAVECAYSG